jgi:beta-mannosidase
LQAEGIKFGLEGHRRAMPYCMGSLYWQINDCWPVASWSSTDYYQKWKALQYYSVKSFAPVLVSPFIEGQALKVSVVSDRQELLQGRLKLKVVDFEGKVLRNYESNIEIPSNTSKLVFDENLEKFLAGNNTTRCMLLADLESFGEIISVNTLYFKPFKELKLPKPTIIHSVNQVVDGFYIVLSTNKLAKNVYLQIGNEEGFFADNYFDLLPGEQVKVHLKTSISLEKLKEVLTIRTLVDAF